MRPLQALLPGVCVCVCVCVCVHVYMCMSVSLIAEVVLTWHALDAVSAWAGVDGKEGKL